jgi:hypothetical protein
VAQFLVILRGVQRRVIIPTRWMDFDNAIAQSVLDITLFAIPNEKRRSGKTWRCAWADWRVVAGCQISDRGLVELNVAARPSTKLALCL